MFSLVGGRLDTSAQQDIVARDKHVSDRDFLAKRVDASERAHDNESQKLDEMQRELGDIRISMEKLDFELHTRLLQIKSDVTKIIPGQGSSQRVTQLETTLELVQREVAEMRQSFVLKQQSVSKEEEWPSMESHQFRSVLDTVSAQQEEMQGSQEKMQRELDELRERARQFNVGKEIQDCATDEGDSNPAPKTAPTQDLEKPVRQRISTTEDLLIYAIDEQVHSFEESVWDMTLFLGHDAVPIIESMVACCLLAFSIFMQGLVCIVLLDIFHGQDDGRIDFAREWRLGSAHKPTNADSQGHSLASRMCRGVSLELSGAQQTDYDSVDKYLDGFQDLAVGQVVCIWCLCLWFFTIWAEVKDEVELNTALYGRLTDADCTRIISLADGFRLESIGRARFMFQAFCSIVRLAVALSVLGAGTVWLTHTDVTTDMILNASALAFVLDLDEMLYALACPKSIKALLTHLEPLPLPRSRRIALIPVKALSSTAALSLYFLLVLPLLLWPHVRLLEDIWDHYCGGAKNFIIGVNPVNGIHYSFWYNEDESVSGQSWLQDIASQHKFRESTGLDITTTDYMVFTSLLAEDMPSTANRYGQCSDWTGATDKFYVPALSWALPNYSNISSCSGLPCGGEKEIVRLACPVSCGCDTLVSGHFLLFGCPFQACKGSESLAQNRQRARRFDIEPQMLETMTEWRMYWDAGLPFLEALDEIENPKGIYSKFLELGCGAFEYFSDEGTPMQEFLCQSRAEELERHDQMQFRPLRPFCPQSCTCHSRRRGNQGLFCPTFIESDDYPWLDYFCAGVQVSGGSVLESEACGQTLHHKSNPEGYYTCKSLRYNGKATYQFEDSEGTLWVIRWETDSNLDWGARFLGTGVGLQSKSKWVLVSMKADETEGIDSSKPDKWFKAKSVPDGKSQPIVPRFFSEGSSTQFDSLELPSPINLLPRNSTNSDADCAAGNLTARIDDKYWMAKEEYATCPVGYDSISSKEGCIEAAVYYEMAEDLIEEIEEEEEEENPKGCLRYTRRRELRFNNVKKSGTGCSKCYPICVQTSPV